MKETQGPVMIWAKALHGKTCDKVKTTRHADNATLMAESEEELKSLLLRVKKEREKAALNSTFKNISSWHLVQSLHGK